MSFVKFIFIGFLLSLNFSSMVCNDDVKRENLVNYYENLIRTEMNKAFHYDLPTSADEHRPKNNLRLEYFGTYDFVVVGSGPGGAVVANRLSEVNDWNVLLIEAGGPESDFSNIPGVFSYLQGSRFNWNFNSTPQTRSCLGMIDNICHIPRGKALGGTSSINNLVYSRGNRNDYDRWAEEGNAGWSYSDVLPYFIKSENAQINGDPGYHGRNGYWNVKYHSPSSKQLNAFLEGSKLVRESIGKDYNGKEELGAFRIQINNVEQFRQSANKAFLQPIADRPNLKILTHSYVTQVMINPLTKTAFGVKFTKDGKNYFARTRKEVILSAGAINSPQILMLSGVGPRRHLQEMKIPVIRNLPVGKTLLDHTLFFGLFVSTNFSAPEFILRESVEQFLDNFGPLTIALNSQGVGCYRSKFETNLKYPDIELKFNPAGGVPNLFVRHTLRVTDDVYNALFKNINSSTTMGIYLFGLRSEAVGKVTLSSKNPFKYPIIDTNILDNEHDVETLYEGIEILEEILKTEPLRKINASLVYADYPQCRDYKMGSKDYWICAFRLLTSSGYHQTSTCRMGPNPANSVVNRKAEVHGINNLRVVDASIIPFPVAGHTTAPTVMVGEKVADIIKLDYGLCIDAISNGNDNKKNK